MPRIVQNTRTDLPNTPPVAGSLLPGQFAVEMGVPTRLWVGVPAALDPTMQKLLIDTSNVGGSITEPVGAGTWGRLATAAWQRSVATAGDTMTGNLTMDNATGIILNRVSGAAGQVQSHTSGVMRWTINVADPSPESTGNAGSNFGIGRFDDGGTYLDAPIYIYRNTGAITFTQPPMIAGVPMDARWVLKAGDTMTGPLALPGMWVNALAGEWSSIIMDRAATFGAHVASTTSGSLRWTTTMATADPETGANFGSNWMIARFNDAGVYLDSPIYIYRNTGTVNFTVPPTVAGLAAPWVLKAGDVMTGALQLPYLQVTAPAASWAGIQMDRAATQGAQVGSSTSGVMRWTLTMATADAETGANFGSNWMLGRFDDGGTYLDAPIYIYRNSGTVGFTVPPLIGGVSMDARWVLKAGDVMTGRLQTPYLDVFDPGSSWGAGGVIRLGAYDQYNWTLSTDAAGTLYIGLVSAGVWSTGLSIASGLVTVPSRLNVNGPVFAYAGAWFSADGTYGASADVNWRYFTWSGGGWWDGWRRTDGLRVWCSYLGIVATMTGTGVFNAYAGVQATSDGALSMFQDPSNIARHFQYAYGWEMYWQISNGDWAFYSVGTRHINFNALNGFVYNNKSAFAGYGAYVDMSDDAIKTNVTPATIGLAEVLALEPINFTRLPPDPPALDTLQEGQEIYVPPEMGEMEPFAPENGFSAQQVQSVIASAVRSVGMKLPDGTDILGVMTTPIVVALVNAVKTLTARIEALEGAR